MDTIQAEMCHDGCFVLYPDSKELRRYRDRNRAELAIRAKIRLRYFEAPRPYRVKIKWLYGDRTVEEMIELKTKEPVRL